MSRVVQKLDQLLFSERIRRYVTFRMASVFVVISLLLTSALDILMGPQTLHEAIRWPPKPTRAPEILVLHAFILVLGFGLIYWSREKKQYYRFRVLLYGMLLGGLVAEILDSLLLPQH